MTPLEVDALLARLVSADVESTRDYCAGLVQQGVPLHRLVDEGLAPAMKQVGALWELGSWSVADEHAATAAAEAGLAAASAAAEDRETSGATVLVASVEGDWHSLPAQMVADVVSSAGFTARVLGASQSPNDLRHHLTRHRPRAALLSCTPTSALPALVGTIAQIRPLEVPVYVGGRALGSDSRRARAVGADGWAPDAGGAVELVRRRPRRVDDGEPLQRYRQYLAGRDGYPAWLDAAKGALARLDYGSTLADSDLAHIIDAASISLLVEDPRVIDEEVRWLSRVLTARGVPAAVVADALRALAEIEPAATSPIRPASAGACLRRAIDMMHLHQVDPCIRVSPTVPAPRENAPMTLGTSDTAESAGTPGTCRVFICDDQLDIRNALSEVIERMPGFEKVGEAADGDGLLEGLPHQDVDVLILDVSMPRGGPQLAREVKRVNPAVKVLVFTAHRDDEVRSEMLAAGADEFVVKTGRLLPLKEALHRMVSAAPST